MTLSMHRIAATSFLQGLGACRATLAKAAQQLPERGITEEALLQARLAPDMFPLVRQVQVATDHAKGAMARLAGAEPPRFPDEEASLAALDGRLARTIEVVQAVAPGAMEGSEARTITLPIGPRGLAFTGESYLLGFALPNFWFHLTAAYAILRHTGFAVGKRDFLGRIEGAGPST